MPLAPQTPAEEVTLALQVLMALSAQLLTVAMPAARDMGFPENVPAW